MGYLGDNIYKILWLSRTVKGPICKPTSYPASFMGTGRRYKTLGLETKDFITPSKSGNQSVTFSCCHFLGPSFYRVI